VEVHRHLVPALAARGHLPLTESELRDWGRELGAAIQPPMLVSLSGELGAGKTTLAQSICEGYGVEEPVTSPTYALVHRYDSPRSAVLHVDLYRLDNEAQLTNIGWDDILNERALVIVEWPERAGELIPAGHVPIALEQVADDPDKRVLLAG
jgi:tRNA threonylcarbamoyladenosine biosynthesis protein TsaE